MSTSRSGKNERVILIDGSWLVFRAFFAIPANLSTRTGLHTNAIYGFATMFRKLLAGRRPDYGAVVFDALGSRVREEKYPEYKGQRPVMPDELGEQVPWIRRLVEAHHFPLFSVEGYEADDAIGTLARQAALAGMEVIIVAGDKDFMQLIGDRVRMQDTLRDVTYDADLVVKKWGVRPSQMVDLLALMGDTVDNIPGVAGIGQKGAAALLEKYGSLDGIYAHLDELKGRQRAALEEHRRLAYLSRDLATIDQQVPLTKTLQELALVPVAPAEVNQLYRELEFYSLLTEEERAEAGKAEAPADLTICDTPEQVAEALGKLGREGAVALVPLHDPPSPVHGAFVGLAAVGPAGGAFYFPLTGEGQRLGLLGEEGVRLLAAYLGDAAVPKVTHNVKALWQLVTRQGLTLAGVVGDTMLASFLLEPTKLVPHRLDQVAKEYLQRLVRTEKAVLGSGQKERRPSELPMAEAAAYAGHLAEVVARLWPVLDERLGAEGYREHLATHELPLAYVLGQMELDGIRADKDDLVRMGEEFAARKAEFERKIYALAGREFNIGSTQQLATVLFEELKLPVIKRTKTGYSTDAEVLERLAPKHEIAKLLLDHRALAKLINTYTDVLTQAIHPATGRIHATFQQTVGASGRLISTDPDLQRTPIRTPEGRRIRQAFLASPGYRILSADWSQIELRVLAHFSEDERLIEAFRENLDVHRRTASELFHCRMEEVTSEQRGVGKTVNFATIYGQGATALGQILGIPRKEAQGYIDHYFEVYAGVRAWLDRTIAEALRTGSVTTLLGRRRNIPELSSKNEADRQTGQRIAANTPIQGSAADLCKLAMLQIARRLRDEGLRTRMLLQVHDELVFEAPEVEVEPVKRLVREVMERPYPLKVPLVVEVGVGRSWGEAH
ncbi:MAG TPA: DNA polymerase I [Polyangia bacterium]|nr:DNA polymerase I [Polyangia bacterium]